MTSYTVSKYNFGMRLFKRANGVYYAELRRGVWRSLYTREEREAKIRFKELQREALRGKLLILDRQSTKPLAEYLNEYDEWISKNRAYSTWERVHFVIPKLIDALGSSKPLSSIKAKDMDTHIYYCKARGNSPETINIEIRHIKAMFSQAVKWEYLRENPFKNVSQIKYHKAPPKFIDSLEKIEKVFSVIGNNKLYRLIFALYVYTGARGQEVNNLNWNDIKQDYIIFRNRKNYKQLRVPIVPRLREILCEYDRGVGRIIKTSKKQMARTLKGYLEKAGLKGFTPHDLRHTFASHLIMSGVDLKTVQELLGHSSYQATLIYSHLRDEHIKEAIKKLPY